MNKEELLEEESPISPIHTACKDCIFAVKDGQSQTDCKLGRIKLYRENGAEVLNAYDEFNNEFFVINNKFCIHKRLKEWGDKFPPHEWEEAVQKQSKPRYQAIVFFRPEHTIKDLHKTMKSLVKQYNSPIVVTVANTNKTITTTKIAQSLENSPLYEKFEWRIQTFLSKDVHDREMIDLIIDQTKYKRFMFYISFNASFRIPSKCSQELQMRIQDTMDLIGIATARKDGNGAMAHYLFHKKHAGNSFHVPLEEKVKEFETDGERFIFNIEDLCPSLKQ